MSRAIPSDDTEEEEESRMRKPLTVVEKRMVRKVYQWVRKQKNERKVRGLPSLKDAVAQALGIAPSTVMNIMQQHRQGVLECPPMQGNRTNHHELVPKCVRTSIRQYVLRQRSKGLSVTATEIVAFLDRERNLKVSIPGMCAILRRMHLSRLTTTGKKHMVDEDSEVRQARRTYLSRIQQNRLCPAEARRPVVFTDESYCHHHHQRSLSFTSASIEQ